MDWIYIQFSCLTFTKSWCVLCGFLSAHSWLTSKEFPNKSLFWSAYVYNIYTHLQQLQVVCRCQYCMFWRYLLGPLKAIVPAPTLRFSCVICWSTSESLWTILEWFFSIIDVSFTNTISALCLQLLKVMFPHPMSSLSPAPSDKIVHFYDKYFIIN